MLLIPVEGRKKTDGGHHPGKYADGAVGFAPTMFEEGLVISAHRYRTGDLFKVCILT